MDLFKISKGIIISFCGVFLITACVGTARITDFPASSAVIDFDKYAQELQTNERPAWTLNTSNEYYFERDLTL